MSEYDTGFSELGGCLVEGDTRQTRKSKRRRLGAVATSAAVQAILGGLLVLIPLLATSEIRTNWKQHTLVVPLGAKQGDSGRAPQNAKPQNPGVRPTAAPGPFLQPPRIPDKIPLGSDELAPPTDAVGEPRVGSGPLWSIGHPDGLPDPWGGGVRVPVVAPPAEKHRPLKVHRDIQEGKLLSRVQLVYPALCKQARIQGTVELRAIIGADGAVRDVETLSGNPLLAMAAKVAVQQWRYRPTLLNGEPVEVETRITVQFVLR